MKTIAKLSTIITLVCAMAFTANANLITNGGFEDPEKNKNGSSRVWVPGWTYTENGGASRTLEIWKSSNAFEGNQFLELNGNSSNNLLVQIVDTLIGNDYIFSFAYRARGNGDEGFTVSIDNGPQSIEQTINIDSKDWLVETIYFRAQDTSTTFSFSSLSGLGTAVNWIDDVKLVSTPATLGLFGLVLFGLGLSRRKA
jgi:hypothetical protein